MMRGMILALVLTLAVLPGETRAAQSSQPPPLVVLLASDQSVYQVGATVTFSLAVDNPGAAPVKVTLPSSQRYDIAVFAGETEVWRWSANRAFPAVIKEPPEYSSGVSLLGRETWDWRDNTGALLPPGTYRVVGSLTTNPPRVGNAIEITLTAP